jgi:hypothetical protein
LTNFIRQGYDMQRGLRALSALLRHAEEGELAILEDESPRTEHLRNARLRAGVWATLVLLATWLTVTLRDLTLAERVPWPVIGATGIAFGLWHLARALRRLG